MPTIQETEKNQTNAAAAGAPVCFKKMAYEDGVNEAVQCRMLCSTCQQPVVGQGKWGCSYQL